MHEDLRRQLSEAIGAGALVRDSNLVIPANVDAAVAAVRVCAAAEAYIAVTSRADSGSAQPGVVLSLQRCNQVTSAPAELTLRAGAGAIVAAVRSEAVKARLAVVGLGAGATSEHVGGLIARGGVPRRALCGIEAVLSTGEHVSFGGGVLKDVVGYDLPALLLGSMGRLAIVLRVTFRLEPEAARTRVAPPPGETEPDAHAVIARALDPLGLLQPLP